MPQQAAQVLDSLIGFCEQDVEPITLPGGNIAPSAPCARFPSTGYSNLASSVGATRAQIQEVMKEMDKVSTIASLVLVKYGGFHKSICNKNNSHMYCRLRSNECMHDWMQ
jgi:hypothetical protein